MRIYKYHLPQPGHSVTMEYRWGARPKLVAMQNGSPYLWAEVHPDSTVRDALVTCIGTGWDAPDDMEYLGTVLDGDFVWHFYIQPEG